MTNLGLKVEQRRILRCSLDVGSFRSDLYDDQFRARLPSGRVTRWCASLRDLSLLTAIDEATLQAAWDAWASERGFRRNAITTQWEALTVRLLEEGLVEADASARARFPSKWSASASFEGAELVRTTLAHSTFVGACAELRIKLAQLASKLPAEIERLGRQLHAIKAALHD